MRLQARAKINWSLDITGVREDGYHLLDMLMQPISLADEIALHVRDDGAICFESSSGDNIPADASNLACRAALLLKEESGCPLGADIRLVKRIPSGAGLGGGSSDAAAVLHGLNQLWALNLPQEQLEAIGLRLGADVPFCLRGGLCRVQGIGERLRPLGAGPAWPLVIVQPCPGLSTAAVYKAWHSVEQNPAIDTDGLIQTLLAGDVHALPAVPGNALEAVSRAMQAAIGEAIDRLFALGAVCAQMSGSGSAVYGVFETEEAAKAAADTLRQVWEKTFVCETCAEGYIRGN